MRQAAVDIVNEHPEFTLDQINAELRRRYPQGAPISRTTLASVLCGQLIVLKKMEDAPTDRNSTQVKDLRFNFADWLMREGLQHNLVFVDEAGLNLWCRRTRGRAHRGERAVRIVNSRRGRNFTMTFAVSPTAGLLHHALSDVGMTSQRFCTFLEETVQHLSGNMQSHVLLFDNAPAHRHAENATLPASCQLRRIPPYSPFLNIVENCFSQWKSRVKRELAAVRHTILILPHDQRMATLAQIAEQEATVTSDDAASFFRHLQTYIPQCMTRSDILM